MGDQTTKTQSSRDSKPTTAAVRLRGDDRFNSKGQAAVPLTSERVQKSNQRHSNLPPTFARSYKRKFKLVNILIAGTGFYMTGWPP